MTSSPLSFPTTCWDEVREAGSDPERLGQLFLRYREPVLHYIRSYLRLRGDRSSDAEDLLQEFMAAMIGRHLLGHATPAKGRFRAYLLRMVRNFCIDAHRRRRGRVPGTRPAMESSSAPLEGPADSSSREAADSFDREWWRLILERAVERTGAECEQNGLSIHWTAFRRRVLDPAVLGGPAPSLHHLAAEFGVPSDSNLSTMIQTAGRRFEESIRREIRATVHADPRGLEAELARFQRRYRTVS